LEDGLDKKIKGTASVLNQTKVYEGLVAEYSTEVANGLLAKAINSALPSANITPGDVNGFSKVTSALRTGDVDLGNTAEKAKSDATEVSETIIASLKKSSSKTEETE
jgi:hypothetical protein